MRSRYAQVVRPFRSLPWPSSARPLLLSIGLLCSLAGSANASGVGAGRNGDVEKIARELLRQWRWVSADADLTEQLGKDESFGPIVQTVATAASEVPDLRREYAATKAGMTHSVIWDEIAALRRAVSTTLKRPFSGEELARRDLIARSVAAADYYQARWFRYVSEIGSFHLNKARNQAASVADRYIDAVRKGLELVTAELEAPTLSSVRGLRPRTFLLRTADVSLAQRVPHQPNLFPVAIRGDRSARRPLLIRNQVSGRDTRALQGPGKGSREPTWA